jgi:aspartate-semialdehyde dehydrogenase
MKVAIVGGETLIGRELQEVIGQRGTDIEVITFAASGEGNFGEEEGEAVYLEPLTAASIQGFQAMLIAGSRTGALKAYELAKEAGGRPVVIDCTGELEDRPEGRIVAPLVRDAADEASWLQIIAQPSASALVLVLTRLARYRPIQRAVAHIFEPASERGKRGVAELHQQTVSLLSFKGLDREIFDAQLGFNLLPQYGEEAPLKLGTVERRIERDFATIAGSQTGSQMVPIPSVRLIQAPVFHGYSISIWIEFDEAINAHALGEALASAQIEVRSETDEAPNAVGVAGQSGLIAGDIRADTNNARAAWLWVVGDNLRMMADAASDILAGLKEVRA